jgi:hypothetical protein
MPREEKVMAQRCRNKLRKRLVGEIGQGVEDAAFGAVDELERRLRCSRDSFQVIL